MKNKPGKFYSRKLFSLFFGLSLVFLYSHTALAAPGDLDQTFGTGGLVVAPIADTQAAQDAAVQADGKIVIVARTGNNFAVARLNRDGTIDTTFGGGRIGITFTGYTSGAKAVVIQPDGKIVVAGSGQSASGGFDFLVTRLNADGSLDMTFNGGATAIQVGTGNDYVNDMALQADGKIVLVGYTDNNVTNADVAVVRLNSNGTLDTTFNDTGKFNTPIASGQAFDSLSAVVIQPDGKIVAAGTDGTNFAALRFNTNGTLDTTFDGDGIANVSFGSTRGSATSVALQADGRIVLGGSINTGSELGNQAALARLNADGSLDATFGTGGKITMTVPRVIVSVIAAADGKITAVGKSGDLIYTGDFILTRFNANGSLDTTFGTGGRVTTSTFNGNNNNNISANTAVAQPDGKILVAGSGINNGIFSFAVARYLTDSTVQRPPAFDYDGDGKADISQFRPSNGVWYLSRSTQGFSAVQFGASGDQIVPADYDGDGKTDIAVYRSGTWYLQRSTLGFVAVQFGQIGDIPAPADFNGDAKAELVVYRPSNGTWYVLNLANNAFNAVQFGIAEDKPVVGDYDGDGKADYAVYRPETGVWYMLQSTKGFAAIQFGISTDKTVPADYDGDGKTDVAVYRPSSGVWYLFNSTTGFAAIQFGLPEDKPTPADYDGDGKTDIAVFRPSSGTWYELRSGSGFFAQQFGLSEDLPAPNAFVR